MFNLAEYTTVSERIKLFRDMYPMGRIITHLIYQDSAVVVFKAELYREDEDARPFSTGYAREIAADRGVNKDFALENCETSAIGIAAKNANIGTEKNSISREEAEKVNRVKAKDESIAKVKLKLAETAKEYVPIAKEDDPWTIREAAPASTVDEAVAMVKDIIGGQTERDIPHCTKCHDHKEMTWKTGQGKNGKPYGNFSCYTCKDIIWYQVVADGTWQPQEKRF